MKIENILDKIEYLEFAGNKADEISDIISDTRKVTEGCAFVCIVGGKFDGHNFADEAIKLGAKLIIMESKTYFEIACKKNDASYLLVENTRKLLPIISNVFYDNPSEKLNLIGVTGTKGKTTTSIMIKNIYDMQNVKTGLVGTMYNMIDDEVIPSERTTPESNDLQKMMAKMVEKGVLTCVMEDSSQGLKTGRVTGCHYNICCFTNLSPDHLGPTEHPTMEDYADSKALLFKMCKKGIFNIDNSWTERIMGQATCEKYTLSIENDADFRAKNIHYKDDGVEYDMCGNFPPIHIKTKIPGKFSVYNSMMAAAVCYLDGAKPEYIQKGLENVVIKGKAELVPTGRDFSVMIDYAHNPDSFINIISTVKQYAKRTVFLFGAGGDRNRPRAFMGETAASYADFTIITSDNPRSEDPAKIVADIEVGAKKTGKPYICIVDRKEAIFYAIENAQPGDVIILAGKGHETTQEFKDRIVKFDEREIVREALESKKQKAKSKKQ